MQIARVVLPVPSIYERVRFLKGLHYIPYWIGVGVMYFLLHIGIIQIAGEVAISPILVFVVTVFAFAVIIGWESIARSFRSTMEGVASIVKLPAEMSDTWIEEEYRTLFTLHTRFPWFVVLFFCVSVTATMLSVGLPFVSNLVKLLFFIELELFLVVIGHGAYFLVALLIFLYRITRYPLNIPFYMTGHPGILSLFAFYSRTAFVVLVLYLLGVLTVWQSPWGLAPQLLLWCTIMALYPLIWFLSSFYHVHRLMLQVKEKDVALINAQVQESLKLLQGQLSKENAETLDKLMALQVVAESRRDWPLTVPGTVTLILTVLTPVTQIAISVLQLTRP